MPEIYESYVLNTEGEKQWAPREISVFKQLIDSDLYTNVNPTPVSVGGISSGTTFDKKPIKDVLDLLLYPYQAPGFSSFAITGQPTTLEVGASTSPNPQFTWSISNPGNITANTISIVNSSNSTSIITGLGNIGAYNSTMSAITNNSATSQTFTINATSNKSVGFSRQTSITWLWRVYTGNSTTPVLTESDVKALTSTNLTSSYSGTKSFSPIGYKYICYPSVMGTASTFKDSSTGMDVAMSAVTQLPITNVNGVTTTYNIHRTLNQIGSAINIIVS